MPRRMFVALPLPPEVRDSLWRAAGALAGGDQPVFRLTETASLHMTLYFLGNLEDGEVEGIRNALSQVQFEQFEVRTGRVIRLPSDNVPKVVAIGLDSDSNDLARFQRRIHDTVFPLAENKETRPFLPHVTLARLVAGVPGYAKPVKRSLANFSSVGRLTWTADTFELLSSSLGDGGPVYETVDTYHLGR